jgi:ABC-type cobalt transport system substrate-binding protein
MDGRFYAREKRREKEGEICEVGSNYIPTYLHIYIPPSTDIQSQNRTAIYEKSAS